MKPNAPFENAKAVTPHNTNTLTNNAGTAPITTRGVVVTAAGLVNFRTASGDRVSVQCAAGIVMPIVTDLIHTDSTATGIVALW